MKKVVLFFAISCISISMFAQKKDKVLVTIDNESIKVSEFKRIYEKNLNAIESEEGKDVKNNLTLFINYKLKVREAYRLQFDTLRTYKREIETYKNQLIAPYLQDKEFLQSLIKEAYYRTVNELNASHILIRLPKNYQDKDTLAAYNKIIAARNSVLAGTSFAAVAKKVSEDPSAKKNGGNLGYFSAFKMVYPFEDAAYKTKIGNISMPFKTRFGYHIVQVHGTRKSKGEVEVAHILVTDKTVSGKKKIDEAYAKLLKGEVFADLAKIYSNDSGSKDKGGKLAKFGTGRMVQPFETAAFSLQKEGEFSKPFKTRFGYHIVQLIKKHPLRSFQLMEKEIASKVTSSGRGRLSDNAVLNKLKKKYNVVVYEEARKVFDTENFRAIPANAMQQTLLSINNKEIKQIDFVKFTRNRRHLSIDALVEKFTDQEILNYYKENLVHTEPEFAYTLKEYEDGLLLFELMQEKIWNKSSKDSIGLQNYFSKNTSKYKTTELKKVKGEVMNDYQTYLETQWIATLRKKSKIKVRKRQLKRLIKFYAKK